MEWVKASHKVRKTRIGFGLRYLHSDDNKRASQMATVFSIPPR